MATLTDAIKKVIFGKGISKKTNKPYSYIDITFINGYEFRTFLSNEQSFILKSLAKTDTVSDFESEIDDVMANEFLEQ